MNPDLEEREREERYLDFEKLKIVIFGHFRRGVGEARSGFFLQ